jgi:hypothetical protein
MLRITDSGPNPSGSTIKLEGKLLKPWVEEVRGLFDAAKGPTLPLLDLSCLSFIDREGMELLQQLLGRGVRITRCSPFVAELLRRDGKWNQ